MIPDDHTNYDLPMVDEAEAWGESGPALATVPVPVNERAGSIPLTGSLQGSHHSHLFPNDNRPTQQSTVLTMLMDADEVCSSAFYANYLPRFSVSIHKLRKAGYVITKRPCDRHEHVGTLWLYRLEALPRLFQ
jgi:hypothetical protein